MANKPRKATKPVEVDSQWTVQDTANYLACSQDTVRRMIARGELKAYRYGPRLIRIDPKDVRRRRRQVTPLADALAPFDDEGAL